MRGRHPKPLEALCPECGWFFRVKRDGRLYQHKSENALHQSEQGKAKWDDLCPGSGDLPAELDEPTIDPGSDLFDPDPASESGRDPRVARFVRTIDRGVRSRWM